MTTTVTTTQPINQRRLKEMLKLSPSVIRHLKETKQLKFKKVGTEDIFDESSVDRFMESFKVDDYLTIGECRKVLEERQYYTIRMGWKRIYYFPLGFYITVKTLIDGNSDIPEEFRLVTKKFGTTQYILKESFKKTLEWLDGIHRKLHPDKSESFGDFTPKQKTPRKKGLAGLRRIGQKKQQKPPSTIIPSMVSVQSSLTH